MKHILILFLILAVSHISAQPRELFQRSFGGTKNDIPGQILETADGGYMLAGRLKSNDGDVSGNHGEYDIWIAKLNPDFSVRWQKCYGGSNSESFGGILEVGHGEFIIAGSTHSIDGDLATTADSKSEDLWIFSIDSVGNIIWQKRYGGTGDEYPVSLIAGGEGEYLILSETNSTNGDIKNFHGGYDMWLVAINQSGSLLWGYNYGGSRDDQAGSILKTSDGGYAVAGYTYSTDGDLKNKKSDSSADYWLIKLTPSGEIAWQKTYGGSSFDFAYSATETLDHGFLLCGETNSNDKDVSGLHGIYYDDSWIIKTDSKGAIEWSKTYGGSNGDAAYSAIQTSDSGYIVSASTASTDGDVSGNHGLSDCWIYKINSSGALQWQDCFGGTWSDASLGSGVMQTKDSNFLVLSMTSSRDLPGRKGDTADFDFWLVKFTLQKSGVKFVQSLSDYSLSLSPNPTASLLKIDYQLDEATDSRIELCDVMGQVLQKYYFPNETTGLHQHTIDLAKYPSGSYYARFSAGRKSFVRRFEILR